jgi:hypothetical protein
VRLRLTALSDSIENRVGRMENVTYRSAGERVRRGAGVLCLAAVAATHLHDVPEHIDDARYVAVLFVALAAASAGLALLLVAGRLVAEAWLTAATLSLVAIVGYVISRTIGLPGMEDHVGHWAEPAGIVALSAEGALVALAARPVGIGFESGASEALVAPAAAATVLLLAFAAGSSVEERLVNPAGVSHHHDGEHEGHAHAATGVVEHEHAHAAAPAHRAHAMHGHVAVTRHGDITMEMHGPGIAEATPAQRREAQRLLRATLAAGRTLYRRTRDARARGFVADRPVTARPVRQVPLLHLKNAAYESDGVVLGPQRPESLVYMKTRGNGRRLVAFMYRAPTGPWPTPNPILRWHAHAECVNRGSYHPLGRTLSDPLCPAPRRLHLGDTMMLHVWMAASLRKGFAMHLPEAARGGRAL